MSPVNFSCYLSFFLFFSYLHNAYPNFSSLPLFFFLVLCRLNALSSFSEDFTQPLQSQKMSVHSADMYRNIGYCLELSVHVEVVVAEEEIEEVEEFSALTHSEHISHFHVS